MQILKDEVRSLIITSGINHFYEKGYEKASMRQIVKDAGTTIGNFYNYFSSKEELFYSITTPIYNGFLSFINSHNENDNLIELKDLDMNYLRVEFYKMFDNLSDIFDKEFIILIDCSKGTKYENIKERLIVILKGHFTEHLKNDLKINDDKYCDIFGNAIAVSFLEGILDILRNNNTKDEKKRIIVDYILFYISGAINIR